MTERVKSEALDAILGQHFPVLDKGFVRVVDYMGDDSSIVQAARVSYGEGTKTPSDDRSLIRYMIRHGHTSPFEQCEIKLHVKLPIFVARQWMRHRMASYNEVSGRYSEIKDEFYVPEPFRMVLQSAENKQGSSEELHPLSEALPDVFDQKFGRDYQLYCAWIKSNLSREIARIELPTSVYTEFYWKIDLHNLFHFLKLRMDKHAQWEIRQYAQAIAEIVKLWVPHAWEAFVDYRLEAVTLSRMEIEVLKGLVGVGPQWLGGPTLLYAQAEEPIGMHCTVGEMGSIGMSKREITEFLEKWR